MRPPIPNFIPPPPSALEESLAEGPEEELEVVDFSELGKFVGAPEVPEVPPADEPPPSTQRTPRPVASDFFEDQLPSLVPPSDAEVRPRRESHDVSRDTVSTNELRKGHDQSQSGSVAESSPISDTVSVDTTHHHVTGSNHPTHLLPLVAPPRGSRSQSVYKEAAMSALDDAMSRIKGALDVMQAAEAPKESHLSSADSDLPAHSAPRSAAPHSLPSAKVVLPKERWVPPAMRTWHIDVDPREVFHITGCEPPRSPKPAWNAFTVRLPKISQALEPLSKRQLQLSNRPPPAARWDVLSWTPPVPGMNRRDFSLNEILFRKQSTYKNRKYVVLLPRKRPLTSITGPKGNISANTGAKVNGIGAFGRPTVADSSPTWRKAPSAPTPASGVPEPLAAMPSDSGLNTTSRSPPPEAQSNPTSTKNDASSKGDAPGGSVRSRQQPKMPAGSAVAFYRDSRIDVVEPEPRSFVRFIVSSELEDPRSSPTSSAKSQPVITVSPASKALPTQAEPTVPTESTSKPPKNGSGSPEYGRPSLVSSKPESKGSDDSVSRLHYYANSLTYIFLTRLTVSLLLRPCIIVIAVLSGISHL